jgi:hypothetical protein
MTKVCLVAHWTTAPTDGWTRHHRDKKEESKSSTKNTDNNTANRGRGRNSDIEQQLENEPTRDATKMEISRTTRRDDPDDILGGEPSRGVLRY